METLTSFAAYSASGFSLEQLQLFDHTDVAAAVPLLAPCPVLRIATGRALHAEPACLYIVLRGALSSQPPDAEGGAALPPRKVLPGECLGELAVLDNEIHAETITALEESDVLAIDAAILWKLVDASNGVARNLLRMLSFRVRAANAQLRRRHKVGEFYRQMSMLDALTGLHNRGWLNEHLPALVDAAQETGQALALIMLDLDHFKAFNDQHGHVAGDQALRVAALVVSAGLRPTDFAARFGGEEMVVLLPGTGREGALGVARRLCERIRGTVVFPSSQRPLPHITASLGVAAIEAGQTGQHAEALISAADAALYRAKQAGRNCTSL